MTKVQKNKFLASFKTETSEHIQAMNICLLELEKDPSQDSLLESLLREIHTIKGAAGIIELDLISDVAHSIEDVLINIKDGRVKIGDVSGILFNCLDAIEEILEAEIQERPPAVDPAQVIAVLEGAQPTNEQRKTKKKKKKNDKNASRKPLGEILIERKIVSKEELENALKEQNTGESYQFEETVRVSIDKLDIIANTVGEIAINRAKYDSYLAELDELSDSVKKQSTTINEFIDFIENCVENDKDSADTRKDFIIKKFKTMQDVIESKLTGISKREQDTFNAMEVITEKLQSDIMALRMLPVSTIFDVFPRAIRDIAKEFNKKVSLEIRGAETELDRKMLEQIKDPLMHLIRNAIDHGIEDKGEREISGKPATGKITLEASQEGDRIILKVIDDGRGLNIEKIKDIAIKKLNIRDSEIAKLNEKDVLQFIFESGISTKSDITDISGRGVGMDVVRNNIEDNLSGEIIVDSKIGLGTVFTLVLPLTLAVTPSVLVESGGQVFALPANHVQLGLRIEESEIQSIEGRKAIRVINSTVPLVRLDEVLELPSREKRINESKNIAKRNPDKSQVVVIEHAQNRIALKIDRLIEEQNIIVKSLDSPLNKIKNIAGVTILEKGEIVPILHIPDLIDSARNIKKNDRKPSLLEQNNENIKKNILVVDDCRTTRELLKSIIESIGYDVRTAVDGVEGLDMLSDQETDLILTDIQMPRMDGFEMTRTIKLDTRYQKIPVVMITSLASNEEIKKGMDSGADAYIKKGEFDQNMLVETLQQLID